MRQMNPAQHVLFLMALAMFFSLLPYPESWRHAVPEVWLLAVVMLARRYPNSLPLSLVVLFSAYADVLAEAPLGLHGTVYLCVAYVLMRFDARLHNFHPLQYACFMGLLIATALGAYAFAVHLYVPSLPSVFHLSQVFTTSFLALWVVL